MGVVGEDGTAEGRLPRLPGTDDGQSTISATVKPSARP